MKIAICSDLHLNFGGITLKNNDNADVLILSGDICEAKDLLELGSQNHNSKYLHSFFKNCSDEFKHIIYIAGNHEHYHGDFATTYTILKDRLGYIQNLHILDKESITIEGVTFIGGTLWTDMNNEDPMTLNAVGSLMNDFQCVKNGASKVTFKDSNGKFHERVAKFSTLDAVADHKKMLDYIRHVIEGKPDQTFVVVGHHAPSRTSTHPIYQNQTLMNGGYSSSLDFFIEDHPQIKLLTHGHTHHSFDYMIGGTRIVCNPRGYAGHESQSANFKMKTIQI